MWQTYSCPACGYGVNAGDRYCGNCGVNLARAGSGFTSTPCADAVSQEIMRRVNAYRKLHPTAQTSNNTTVQNRNISNAANRTAAVPIRSEIIKLLSNLLNN